MLAIIFEYYANPVMTAICVKTVFTSSVHGDRLQSVNETGYLQLQRRYAEKNNSVLFVTLFYGCTSMICYTMHIFHM